MTTNQIFEAHNKKLKEKLFPNPNNPIYGNSILDKNEPIYQKPIKPKKNL